MSGIVEDIIDEVDKINFHYQGVFGVEDIMDAIATYLHSDIETNLGWAQDEFIIALAILDRRCGKRRLEEYANWNYSGFPEWLRRICQIRFDAERIRYNKHYEIAKTHNVHFESEKSNIKK